MTVLHDVVESPIGPLTLVVEDGELCGLWMDPVPRAATAERLGPRSAGVAARVAEQLREYFAGDRTAFDLPLRMAGSAFQRSVWELLRTIPYGETRTYGQLAAALDKPHAARAVGLANGANPISIIVPCHRVIGADGSLTGYGGGLARKRSLLDHERAQRQPRLFG